MTAANQKPSRPLGQRVARQGALLFSGFALSQGLSFARNSLIGHGLSKGDFGIAATITLMLQLIDTLSDLGADRLVVQASDGDEPHVVATAHATLAARGLLTGLLLYLSAGPIADFFQIPQTRWAFEFAAIVPLLKGLVHLDPRRATRRLDNRPSLVVEVVPQAAALALTLPLLRYDAGYAAVLWLSLIQAALAVLASHMLAERAYRMQLDRDVLRRLIAFGWPIWASAFPLIAVYQGDRVVIGRLLGMEALAAYSAAFMVTMVPGLIAAKIGGALMLPLLSEAKRTGGSVRDRFALMCDATALAACGYLAAFTIAGAAVLPLAFGRNYEGLGNLVTWLAAMWSLRMMQAVPGMALMAHGATRPLLLAGVLRAAAVLLSAVAAWRGLGLDWIAAAGCLGELASLAYVAWAAEQSESGLARPLVTRTALLLPAGLVAVLPLSLMPVEAGLGTTAAVTAMLLGLIVGAALAILPGLRQMAIVLRPARFADTQ